MRGTKSGRLWRKRLLVGLLGFVAVDQLLLYTVLSDGVLLGNVVAPFSQPLFSDLQRRLLSDFELSLAGDRAHFESQSQFDAELGWCPRRGGRWAGAEFDWAGSRLGVSPLPRERVAGERLIGLVGCSFTLGSEVRDEETWARALDLRWPDTRVGNFGVAGYGVDQAYLRYRRDVAPLRPDEVWLGFFPNAALRASSRFPPLYHRWRARGILFKPRFSLEPSGELRLHPSPAQRPEDIVRLLHDQTAFLEALGQDDPWIARARAAYLPLGTHWSHYSAFARLFLTLHERRGRDVPASLKDESGALFRLNLAVMLAFAREVEATGARFRILILPGWRELEEFATRGQGYWQPLVASLRAQGLEVLDLTEGMLEAGVNQGQEFWMPGGHHSARTHRIITKIIAKQVREP
jgi:hypothetical protein